MTALFEERTRKRGTLFKRTTCCLHQKVIRTTILKDILFSLVLNIAVGFILFWVILGFLEVG